MRFFDVRRFIAMVFCVVAYSSAVLAQQPKPAQLFDRDTWLQKILALKTHKETAFQVMPVLVKDYPNEAFGVTESAWPRVEQNEVKTGILKAFTFANHSRVLDVLDLGVKDPAPEVQRYALTYASQYGYQDFAADFSAYERWRENNRGRPVTDVAAESCTKFVGQLREASGTERGVLARRVQTQNLSFDNFPEVRQAALDAGILEVFASWLSEQQPDRDCVRAATVMLRSIHPPDSYVREVLMPLAVDSPSEEVHHAVFIALQSKEYAAVARDFCVERLSKESNGRMLWPIAQCLAAYEDMSVIPEMIAIIVVKSDYNTVYGIGYFGLSKLTGVGYDETHDGAWWLDWWAKNKARLPENVRTLEIPNLAGKIAYKGERSN